MEGLGLVGVAGDSVGEGARELVAEFAEGNAEAVDNLFVCIYFVGGMFIKRVWE